LAGVSLPLPLAGPHSGLPSRAARRAAEATSAKIEMYCDEARLGGDGTLSVKGWATCKAGIARVRVLLNDQDVGLAALGHDRPDVGRIFHSIPMAHLSGFKFERKVCEQISGEHKVRVIACNMHNDERHKEIAVVAVPLDAQAVSQPAALPSDPATEPAAEFRFELDSPRVTNGVASATVSGRLPSMAGCSAAPASLNSKCCWTVSGLAMRITASPGRTSGRHFRSGPMRCGPAMRSTVRRAA
jgi:hypothetical protein